jgi:exodeoxyribonuclease V alpha subunit
MAKISAVDPRPGVIELPNALWVIDTEPERLQEVPGIGPVRAKRITSAWAEQKVVWEIMVFLHERGVGTARALRIFKTVRCRRRRGDEHEPLPPRPRHPRHRFKTADAIAIKLGVETTAMIRVRAGTRPERRCRSVESR